MKRSTYTDSRAAATAAVKKHGSVARAMDEQIAKAGSKIQQASVNQRNARDSFRAQLQRKLSAESTDNNGYDRNKGEPGNRPTPAPRTGRLQNN